MVADEKHAATGTRNFNWRPQKNRAEGVEQATPSYLKTLYKLMPARMQADIAQKGGHTKY